MVAAASRSELAPAEPRLQPRWECAGRGCVDGARAVLVAIEHGWS